MMFDPPDFPYKELSETLRDHYDSDYLLFNVDTTTTDAVSSINKDMAGPADQIISNVGNHIDFDTTECLDTGHTSFLGNSTTNLNAEQSTELYIVQSDNLLSYEPTLLDENTVNQFLLPLQISSGANKVIVMYLLFFITTYIFYVCYIFNSTVPDLKLLAIFQTTSLMLFNNFRRLKTPGRIYWPCTLASFAMRYSPLRPTFWTILFHSMPLNPIQIRCQVAH